MRIRRCATLWLEPREIAHFELDDLLAGGTGVVSRLQWFAHAPQLPAPVEVVPDDVVLLGSLSPQDWVAATPGLRMHAVEATYLAWIDAGEYCRQHGIADIHALFLGQGVALSPGRDFSPDCAHHVRLNFGCSRQLLCQALDRMAKALK